MKNIIFDWSGVIKDAFSSHLWVVNRIFRKYNLNEFTPDKFKMEWEEPYMLFYSKYIPGLTMEEEQSLYREGVLDKNYPAAGAFPGITDLIKKIKKDGDYVAVITSDLADSVTPEIKKYGLENVFNDVVVKVHDKAESVGVLIKNNKLSRQSTFIVGDSKNEINAAKELGIKSIAVTWGLAPEQKLISAEPDFIARSVEELENIIFGEN